MIGVGRPKQYVNVVDRPLSKGKTEVHILTCHTFAACRNR